MHRFGIGAKTQTASTCFIRAGPGRKYRMKMNRATLQASRNPRMERMSLRSSFLICSSNETPSMSITSGAFALPTKPASSITGVGRDRCSSEIIVMNR